MFSGALSGETEWQYAIGYGVYGFVSGYLLSAIAMAILTTGEMLVAPTGQALAAKFAPEDMRGRYMGAFGFTWTIPAIVGPLIAGLIMDNADQRWLWFVVGLVGLGSAGSFALLQRRVELPPEAATGAARQSDAVGE